MAVVDVGRVGGPPLDVAPPTHHSDDSALRRVLPIEKAYDKSFILLLIKVIKIQKLPMQMIMLIKKKQYSK